MANYSQHIPTYIKAENEDQLQKALRDLALQSGRLLRPLAVYPKGSYVYCWFVLDIQNARLASENNAKVTKKVVAKKATKKTN